MFRKMTTMPDAGEALPGRSEAIQVPDTHFVLGTPTKPPWPEGHETVLFGMGCFWGAERIFWKIDGVHTTAAGYAAGFTPNPSYEEVCTGRTGHNEVALVVFDPAKVSFETLLAAFWENHDPTQSMRQGNDVGTQYRSGIYVTTDEQREIAEAVEGPVPGAARRLRVRHDHHRDPRRRPLLLRRDLPPAVPRQEPQWVLQPRLLPDRLLQPGSLGIVV